MDLQNCKYVEIRRREIWIVILGLKKPVIKKLFHVSSTSTSRAVFLILINITKILNNLLGSNIKVWKVLLYTFHNSKRTFVVQPMEHYILNVEHIYLLLTALQFSVCITVTNSDVFIGTEQIRWTLKKVILKFLNITGVFRFCCMTIDDGKKNHNDTR